MWAATVFCYVECQRMPLLALCSFIPPRGVRTRCDNMPRRDFLETELSASARVNLTRATEALSSVPICLCKHFFFAGRFFCVLKAYKDAMEQTSCANIVFNIVEQLSS